ncbi:hypothetical protein G7Z17_g2486 [Cylindrodendrum hubeiense]|uniref:Uncharacterized protein n=1 Tax=Cylindrodendrum hubeiense TaxID=595255 RepID=A0A9P5LKA4_9HYPO|nr:hypothetical protein G7Z17_g2486 [Cylindrodendrum hubeiense]
MATPLQPTTGSIRHALQLPDADPADLTVDLLVMDAHDHKEPKKIGRLIRRENHADVYSVHDPNNDVEYIDIEARAFILDGIPAKLKRYRKRCIKRLEGPEKFSLNTVWPKERLPEWLDLKTKETGIPPPAYNDEGHLRSLTQLDLPDVFINTPKLRKWIESLENHRRFLIGGLRDLEGLSWAFSKRLDLLRELQEILSGMDYDQLFSGVHFALACLANIGAVSLLVKGTSPRHEVLQHVQKVLPRLVHDVEEACEEIEGKLRKRVASIAKAEKGRQEHVAKGLFQVVHVRFGMSIFLILYYVYWRIYGTEILGGGEKNPEHQASVDRSAVHYLFLRSPTLPSSALVDVYLMRADAVDGVATATSVEATAVAVVSPHMLAMLILSSGMSTTADVYGAKVDVLQMPLQRPEFVSQLGWDTLGAGLDAVDSEVGFLHELDADELDEGAMLLGEVTHVDGVNDCGRGQETE